MCFFVGADRYHIYIPAQNDQNFLAPKDDSKNVFREKSFSRFWLRFFFFFSDLSLEKIDFFCVEEIPLEIRNLNI